MMDIKEFLLLWFTIFFDKKSAGSGVAAPANNACHLDLATHQLADESHKPIIKN